MNVLVFMKNATLIFLDGNLVGLAAFYLEIKSNLS